MAKDKLLYDDIIDKSVKEGIDALKKSMNELYESFKKLTEQSVKNSTSTKDAASSTKKLSEEQRRINEEEKRAEKIARDLKNAREKLTIEYQRQQRQQREAIRTAKLKEIADNKELGTVQRLTAANQLLIDKRNKLNLDTEKGRKKAEQYNKQIDKNTQIIKTNSSAVEQQRMNIGNYSSALSNLHPAFGMAINGIQRFSTALKTLLLAPLGLVVGAIGLVVGAFKLFASTDTGGTTIQAEWKGVKSALDEARQSALNGDWKKAFSILTGGFSSARKAAIEYTFTVDGINDRIAFQRGQLAQMELEIAEYENKAKDRGLSAQARYDAANKAMDLRIEKLKIEKKNAEELYFAEVKRISGLSGVQTKILDLFARGTDEQRKQLLASNEALRNFRENSEEELFILSEKAAEKLGVETSFQKETKRLVSERSSLKIQLAKETADEEIRQMQRVMEYEKSRVDLQIQTTEDLYEKIRLEEEKGQKDFEARIDEQEKLMQKHLADRMGADALPEFQMEYETQLNIISSEYLRFQRNIELQRKELRKKENEELIKRLEQQRDFRTSELELWGAGQSAIFASEQRFNEQILELRKKYGLLNEIEYKTQANNMAVARKQQQQKELEETQAMFNEMNLSLPENESANEDFSFFESPVTFKEKFENYKEVYQAAGQSIVDITREHYEQMREIADMEKQLADDKVSNARDYFNQQQNLAAQGFQNNMAQAEKELLLAKQTQEKAEREQRKALRNQQILQSIEQGANLLTASTSIYNTAKGNPLIYIPLLATMWGSFFVQKAKSVTATRYGKGGMFDVGGGSHDSGNDTSLGVHGGVERVVEGGEKVFVVNKTSSKKYRNMLPNLVDSINKGNLSVKVDSRGNIVNISTERMERGIDKIAKNTSTITYMKNGKTIIKQGLNTIEYV